MSIIIDVSCEQKDKLIFFMKKVEDFYVKKMELLHPEDFNMEENISIISGTVWYNESYPVELGTLLFNKKTLKKLKTPEKLFEAWMKSDGEAIDTAYELCQ